MRLPLAIVVLLALAVPTIAQACATTASYRSVVLNQIPPDIPENATLYRVRIEEKYLVPITYNTGNEPRTTIEMQGIAGVILSDNGTDYERPFEIKARFSSLCDTWVEQWTSDHAVSDSILSGYIVGNPIGQKDDRLIIFPMLFRSASDRKAVDSYRSGASHGEWLHTRAKRSPSYNPKRYLPREGGEWKPFRVDAEVLGSQLEETNRLIREGLKKAEAGEVQE